MASRSPRGQWVKSLHPEKSFDDSLVQIMAQRHQAISHYLKQGWPRCMRVIVSLLVGCKAVYCLDIFDRMCNSESVTLRNNTWSCIIYIFHIEWFWQDQIKGLVQDCSNSIANALNPGMGFSGFFSYHENFWAFAGPRLNLAWFSWF